jgi:hypothetical protein
MLRVLGDNPNVRLLFTLVDGNYRIVAKRSAGITRLADLKGKRIVVPRNTSANYHLVAMLRTADLLESDVTLVTAPATAMAAAMVRGEADAISMWEPESENAVQAIGKDAIVFQNNEVYRELYSVYSTTDVMNDPRRRKELIAFVRATLAAAADLQKDPKRYFPLMSEKTKHPQDQIARSWEHHGFPLRVAPRSRIEHRGAVRSSPVSSTRRFSRKRDPRPIAEVVAAPIADGAQAVLTRVRRLRHSSRVCPQISTVSCSNGGGNCPGPRLRDPSLHATRCDATLSGAIEWIISVQPRTSNAHSAVASAASVA